MKKKIYETQEWKGYGKQNYYHNEYFQDKDIITKFKCNRRKFFNGEENEWLETKREEISWNKGDSDIPSWLKKHIK